MPSSLSSAGTSHSARSFVRQDNEEEGSRSRVHVCTGISGNAVLERRPGRRPHTTEKLCASISPTLSSLSRRKRETNGDNGIPKLCPKISHVARPLPVPRHESWLAREVAGASSRNAYEAILLRDLPHCAMPSIESTMDGIRIVKAHLSQERRIWRARLFPVHSKISMIYPFSFPRGERGGEYVRQTYLRIQR